MISWSQICYNTPMFCISAIFVKYCYAIVSWFLQLMSQYVLFGEKSLWNRTIPLHGMMRCRQRQSLQFYSRARTRLWRGFSKLTLSVKTGIFFNTYIYTKVCTYVSLRHTLSHYQWLRPNCCKGNTFWDIDPIKCNNACRGPCVTSTRPHDMHEPSIHRGESIVRWWSSPARGHPLTQTKFRDVGSQSRIWRSANGRPKMGHHQLPIWDPKIVHSQDML